MERGISIILIQYFMVQIMKKRNFIEETAMNDNLSKHVTNWPG